MTRVTPRVLSVCLCAIKEVMSEAGAYSCMRRRDIGMLFGLTIILTSIMVLNQTPPFLYTEASSSSLTVDDVLISTEKNNVVRTYLSCHCRGGIDYSIVDGPQDGRLQIAGRYITYIPEPDFVGTDHFTYRGENGRGDTSNIATVTVNVEEPRPDDLIQHIYPTVDESIFYPSTKIVKTFDARQFMRLYSTKPSEPSVEAIIDSHVPYINQEFSGYMKLKTMIKPEPIELVIRGGVHSSGYTLQGTSYHVELMSDGSTDDKLHVERPHHDLSSADRYVKPLFDLPNLVGKTFGFKVVSYVTQENNVKIECYVDLDGLKSDGTPANNWRKYFEITDSGQIPKGKITMPYGTLSMVRIDNIKEVPTFYYLDVREIEPQETES
jgi:hypothetical protein